MRETDVPPISRSAKPAPSLALLAGLVAAAALVAALAGAFGTGRLPFGARLFLFLTVIGWNALKWGLWFRFAAPLLDARGVPAAVQIGAAIVLLNLTLPFELTLAFAGLGYRPGLPWLPIYGAAVAISLVLDRVIALVTAAMRNDARPDAVDAAGGEAPAAPPAVPGFLGEAGVAELRLLLAVEAEDHYVRLHLADGRRPLVLHGFGRAVAALADADGMQVHRGAWVAAGAVAGPVRDGRKWRLRLTDGTLIPVSDRHVAALRARDWLRTQRA